MSFFLEQHFCCAKSVACGRVIEREWGNPQRFPPHTPPSLRYGDMRGCEQQNLRVITKRKTTLWVVFLFGMPRAGWNSLPRPARSASNRSVGDGVPDVPSARRCRAGNGFPCCFAPRSKCPWGTHWRGNPFLKRINSAFFADFCLKRYGFPRRFAPRSKCPWGTPRNDRSVGLSTRRKEPSLLGWLLLISAYHSALVRCRCSPRCSMGT